MDATRFPHALLAVALGLVASPKVPYLEAATTNVPPRISIVRPPPPSATDGVGLFLKIKAEASDPDGTIAAVQFMVGTNTIGLVTNAPFNVLWFAGYDEPAGGPWVITAVATDNSGAKTESLPVSISASCLLCPPLAFVDIVAPYEGEIFAEPARFQFSGEVLTSLGDAGPMEFFVGTNSAGIAGNRTALEPDTPPTSVTVSNLTEGVYNLSI